MHETCSEDGSDAADAEAQPGQTEAVCWFGPCAKISKLQTLHDLEAEENSPDRQRAEEADAAVIGEIRLRFSVATCTASFERLRHGCGNAMWKYFPDEIWRGQECSVLRSEHVYLRDDPVERPA